MTHDTSTHVHNPDPPFRCTCGARLSQRESQALAFIEKTLRLSGRAPYQREIAEHFGTRSRGFVLRVLENLEAKGRINRQLYAIRGIKVAERAA